MANALADLQLRFRSVDGTARFERLLREAEALFLDESREWLMLMQSVSLDLH